MALRLAALRVAQAGGTAGSAVKLAARLVEPLLALR